MVIDINYFPGFEKLPNYENHMVEFLTSMLQGKAEDPRALKKFVSFSQKPLGRATSAH